jgi:TolB-like protein
MIGRWLPAFALALAATSAAPRTRAADAGPDKQRVAIVRLDYDGTVPDAVRELLTQKLIEGLTAVAFDVIGGASVSEKIVGDAKVSACRDEVCYPQVAAALNVSYLVAGAIQEKEKSYSIALELVNGRNGQIVGSNRERCEICGLEEAGEKMALAAAGLRQRLEALVKSPSRIVIRTRPEGARVVIDERPAGKSPLDTTLAGGRHLVRVSMDGYTTTERTITVVAGVDENVELDLVRLPTKFPFRTAGWTAIVAGGLSVLVGGVLVILDGNEVSCQPDEKDMRGHCPEVWNTGGVGAALLGIGAAAGTLGGVWLYLGSPQGGAVGRRDEALNGATLGWRGRF